MPGLQERSKDLFDAPTPEAAGCAFPARLKGTKLENVMNELEYLRVLIECNDSSVPNACADACQLFKGEWRFK